TPGVDKSPRVAARAPVQYLVQYPVDPWARGGTGAGAASALALALRCGALAGGYRQSAALSGWALSQRPGLAAPCVADPAGLAVWRQYGMQSGDDAEHQRSLVHWLRAPHLPLDGASAWHRRWGRVSAAGRLRLQVALATRQKTVAHWL